jgi:hypothetical protein
MRLAIGSGPAFRTANARHGADLFERPETVRKTLAWWRAQGVQGLVFYDTFPDFQLDGRARRGRHRFPRGGGAPLERGLQGLGLKRGWQR